MLRLWTPEPIERRSEDALRGTVVHVLSGRTESFTSDEQLLSFVRENAGARSVEPTGGHSQT